MQAILRSSRGSFEPLRAERQRLIKPASHGSIRSINHQNPIGFWQVG